MSRKKRALAKEKQQLEIKKPVAKSAFHFSHNWAIGLILVATFLAFANTINHDFAYDDTTQILKNETIRSFSNISTAFTKEVWFWRQMQDKDPNAATEPTTPYYRPLFTVYLMTGWSLFGTYAKGWHFANVLLHLLAVYFAFLILIRITKNLRVTSIATLLFALHPLRTESVAWISGMTDLFLALFLLPSFYLYMIYREKKSIKYLIASLFLFLLATFSKEPAVALPLFIFAYEVFLLDLDRKLKDRIKSALLFSSTFLLVSIFYFILRYQALGFILSDSKYVYYPFHQVLLTIPLAICKYIGLLFWPVNLSIFHATPIVKSPLDWRFIIPLVILMALAAALWQLRKNSIARFAILWFAINLLPVLNLGAFGADFLVQERYVYIPSIGFSLLLAAALVKIPIEKWFTLGSRRTAQAALVGLIALLLTGKTIAQNNVWKDDMTLWEYGAEIAPDQPMSHFVLGHKYINEQRWDKVTESLESYMKLRSDNIVVITNLASAHLLLYQAEQRQNPGSSDRTHLDRIIALSEIGINKGNAPATLLDTLGVVYTYNTSLKNYDRAIWFIQHGLEQEPDNPVFNLHLGQALLMRGDMAKGDIDNALHYLVTARQLQPNMYDAYKFLAFAYKGKGKFQEAVDNFNQYLKMQPNAPDVPTVNQQLKDLRAQLGTDSPQS